MVVSQKRLQSCQPLAILMAVTDEDQVAFGRRLHDSVPGSRSSSLGGVLMAGPHSGSYRGSSVIVETLESARCVVVVWSRVPVASSWLREEADEGRKWN